MTFLSLKKNKIISPLLINFFIIIIITKNYIAHMQDGTLNHQIESDVHKKVYLTNV